MRMLAVAFVLACLCGCVSVSSRYEEAKKQNTASAYEEFLSHYPMSEFSDDARARLVLLDFNQARTEGTIAALREFLTRHPQSRLALDARDRLQELSFNQAEAQGTIAAYEEFLARYPDGRLAPDAQDRLQALYFNQAKTLATITAFEDFLTRYPQSRFAPDARESLLRLYAQKVRLRIGWSASAARDLPQGQLTELQKCFVQALEKANTRIVFDVDAPEMVVSYDEKSSTEVGYNYDGSKLVEAGEKGKIAFVVQFSLRNNRGEEVFNKTYEGEVVTPVVKEQMGQVNVLRISGVPFEALRKQVERCLERELLYSPTAKTKAPETDTGDVINSLKDSLERRR